MLRRLRNARLLLPTALVLAALAVLVGLGTWQLQRKTWKDGIIAGLKDGASRPPIAYADWLGTADIFPASGSRPGGGPRYVVDGREFVRVEATGRFQHEHESYAYTIRNGRPGYAVFTPLLMADGRTVVVNRGYVPQELREPAKRAYSLPHGVVTIRGLTRKPAIPSFFTPPDDATHRISFSGSAGSHPLAGSERSPAGIYIEAEPSGNASPWPRPRSPAELLAIVPNRHLEYALTWFGLAAALIGVFMTFAVGRLRAKAKAAHRSSPLTQARTPGSHPHSGE